MVVTIDTFTTSGTFAPTTIVLALVEAWGGGGAGGIAVVGANPGGGGGGGGYSRSNFTLGAGNYTVTVGAGGVGFGHAGDDTTFGFGLQTFVVAKGGGSAGGTGGGSTGGAASGGKGQTKFSGGDGSAANPGVASGGGGAAGGSTGDGGAGSVSAGGVPAVGGGGGAGGDGGALDADGHIGIAPGGGGGGRGPSTGAARAVGDGADGKVVITWEEIISISPPLGSRLYPYKKVFHPLLAMTPDVNQAVVVQPAPTIIFPPAVYRIPMKNAPWNSSHVSVPPPAPIVGPPGPSPGASVPGRGKPLIRRVRETDSESGKNRQRNASEVTSSLINSLLAQGMIVMTGQNTYAIRSGSYTSTAAPTVNDDVSQGFFVGQLWVDTTMGNVYVNASNAIGAAVWRGPIT